MCCMINFVVYHLMSIQCIPTFISTNYTYNKQGMCSLLYKLYQKTFEQPNRSDPTMYTCAYICTHFP